MTKIVLHHVAPTGAEEEKQCFFSKERFTPGRLRCYFGHEEVSLKEAMKRGFELAPDFERPAVSTRVELSSWLHDNGISRVESFMAYTQMYKLLGEGLDSGTEDRFKIKQ